MRRSLFFVLLLIVCTTTWANEPNTLISIHKVELNNKNKPIKKTYFKKYSTYQLINERTQKIKSIHQNGKAKAVYLEPGRYCFKSFNISGSQRINILNPLCFEVSGNVITNAGTWVIGSRISGSNWYSLLIDMKENYSELESILEVGNSVPAVVFKPQEK
ncbi:hypothetical protein ACFOEW_15595 [Alteromonas oceani]|jgi:hypothetical protein|uniref:Uncharacterized protein n=1 Tax=Alteromonas oceani TaxID=2071609 RepID=A0ABV7JYN3_9ALTE|nr:hypothetical protein [Alteromonas oceani]